MADDLVNVTDALDHLVNQFSDPLSFLRELIQNAVDAGSREVEVWLEHQPGEGGLGTMILHVDDFGEGMDRRIIDTRLTRLFSSSKEGDLTRIGRFGIGFASVFAIAPEAVCVDTARGGESWRVLFQKDRSFSRIERDEPGEGTQIQVIKAVTEAEYADYRRRAGEVLRYWCKHLEAEVRFEGEAINEALDVEAPIKVRRSEPGTEIVAGYTSDGSSFSGFYNKGLTLLEQTIGSGSAPKVAFYPKVAFKVSSRYLEHTLTRDNVLEDESYRKALAMVDELVEKELPRALYARLDEALRQPGQDGAELTWLQRSVAWHLGRRSLKLDPKQLKPLQHLAIVADVRGRPVPLGEARAAAEKGRLLGARQASPLTDVLGEQGTLCVLSAGGSGIVLEALLGAPADLAEGRFCHPLPVGDEELRRWRPLGEALGALLRATGFKVASLELGRLGYPGSALADRPAITQRRFGELTPLAESRQLGASLLSRRRCLVINVDHETVRELLTLGQAEPEMAAYTLAKLFFLGEQLDPELDSKLLRHSVETRWQRQSG